MSTDVQTMLGSNKKSLRLAIEDYVRAMDESELSRQLQSAATTALYSGDGVAASSLRALLNGPDAWGQYLKNFTSILLRDRPEFLRHFSPEFNKNILSRVKTS